MGFHQNYKGWKAKGLITWEVEEDITATTVSAIFPRASQLLFGFRVRILKGLRPKARVNGWAQNKPKPSETHWLSLGSS